MSTMTWLRSCGYCLLRRGLRCEQRCRMRQRSVWLQELFVFLAFGWIVKLSGKIARCIFKICCEKKVAIVYPQYLPGLILASSKTAESLNSPLTQPTLPTPQTPKHRTTSSDGRPAGLGRFGGDRSDAFDAKLVNSAKRSDARGVRTLEETLAHFELNAPQEDAENVGLLESLLEAGFEEKMFEAGFTGGPPGLQDEVLELDLHLVDEDQAVEVPEELPEDDDLMDCEEELHIN
eukprot:symbB.v1.2.006869.t1/scaffold382.1/size215954/3